MKKFFTAVILAVFILSAQIAFAEDVDWNSAPRINSKAQLARYIENERRKGNNKIRVILTNGLKITDKEDFANIALCIDVNGTYHDNNNGTMRIDYDIIEYPGTRVANAYLSRNKEQAWMNLTNEEQQLYNIAVIIADKAKNYSSNIEKARYIHDAIHGRVKIWETIDGATAIDAIIRGKTDCEGFADAFYTIGRIAGLNVGRIRGTINNGKTKHAWNWITLEDGRTYCVDVSQDWIEWKKSSDKHKYFIVPAQTLKNNTYWCEWSIIPNLQ